MSLVEIRACAQYLSVQYYVMSVKYLSKPKIFVSDETAHGKPIYLL
jgi:hypothetical protein